MTHKPIATLLLTAALVGCAAMPAPSPLALAAPLAWDANSDASLPAGSLSEQAFWSGFNSPQLLALLQQAARANPDLLIAANRLAIARDDLRIAQAHQQPRLGFALGTVDTTATLLKHPHDNQPAAFALGFNASYELDLWGRLASLARSAQATAQASTYDAESARIALTSEVAERYFDVSQAVEEQQLLQQRLALVQEQLSLQTARQTAGRINGQTLAHAQSAVDILHIEIDEGRRRQRTSEYQLAQLVGRLPENFTIQALPLRQHVTLPPVPGGLPSSLLQRRPDLSAARARLAAARYKFAAARAARFPKISLTAELGVASDVLHNITHGAVGIFGFGPEVTLPLYDGGERDAGIDASKRTADIALLEYRKAALAAFSDVENALLMRQAALARQALYKKNSSREQHNLRMLNARVNAGRGSRLDVIALREQKLDAQGAALKNYRAQLDSLLALFQALGGGWQPEHVADAL